MDNKSLPYPGSHDVQSFALPSRKRKLRSSNLPEATSEFHMPRVSSLNPIGSFHGTTGRGDTHASGPNENIISESPSFHFSNSFSDASLSGNVNFPVGEIGGMSDLPLNLTTQSSQHEGQPPQINVPSGGIFEVPNCTEQECPSYGQSQAHKGLSFTVSSVPDTGKPQLNPWLEDVVSSLTKNDDISLKLPLEVHNPSSKLLIPFGTSQEKFSQPSDSADDFLGRACSGGSAHSKNSSELNNPGQYSGNEGLSNLPSGVNYWELPAYQEEKGKKCSIHHDIEHYLGVSADNVSQRGDRGRSNCHLNEPESADDEQKHHSSTGKALPNPGSVQASSDRLDCTSGLSHKFDENRLRCQQTASVCSEKLWDGSLQLNSSITMSAVAFFRSGERMVDINWSKFVEVKGKVRLDAFEKYIHDLPRARTRGLMVISVCAKEGSSDKELNRMKEVAVGYREGERVGLADLSHGVNLYLCPRSDQIFTILAKHGFLKGVTAIEGQSDSFIGCVVWRKNQTTASSAANEKHSSSPFSKESKKSPSDSSAAKPSLETSMSPVQPTHNSISLGSATPLSAVESISVAGNKVVIGNSSGADLSTISSVPASLYIRAVQQGSGHLHLSSQTFKGHHLEREASSDGYSETMLPKPSSELPKMSVSHPPSVMKPMLPFDDDDDLPEYDFGTLYGNAFTSISMAQGAPIAGRLQTERDKNVDGAVLPAMPGNYSLFASNSRTDNLSNPSLSSNVNQGMPLPRSVADQDQQPGFHVSGTLEDQHGFREYATPVAASATSYVPHKIHSGALSESNIFCSGDDDISEWLPPQHQMPSFAERNKPSAAMPSEFSTSTFQNQQVPRRPLFHSPPSVAIHRDSSSQGPPRPNYPPTNPRLPPPISFEYGPSSLTEFQRNAVLRPPSGTFAANHPVRPAYGRGWRP